MSLKLLSIPELDFHKSWYRGWNKIKDMKRLDKFMSVFWILGPFIYLIERDPADLWLTSIGIIFLVRCFKKNDWLWASQFWFKSALALWLFSLFSAVTGPDPLFTFQQGFVWIRFPIYAAAAQAWLAKDKDIRIVMLLSILCAMILICFILIAENILEPKGKLMWPYGDAVPGSYLTKISLPLFCVLVAVSVRYINYLSLFSFIIVFFSLIVSLMIGERINLIIRICAGFLASILWKPNFKLIIILFLIISTGFSYTLLKRPDIKTHYFVHFIKYVPILNTSDDNSYWGAWRGGIQQGIQNPMKGIGPSGTRNSCKKLNDDIPEWLPGKNYCGNHPHNFYIQLFAESGIIGLTLGALMFGSIIITCFKARLDNKNCPMAATAFVTPFALFFPFQQFGSFFGQWGNLFIWFAIAFALSQYQSWDKLNTNLQK
ncbi:O-antigen ligase family protein [Alphaproteobacteria bacterium]|nr:O-antigen ligase family protein [Alphaproteobacteria bacterium]